MQINFKRSLINTVLFAYTLAAVYFLTGYFMGTLPSKEHFLDIDKIKVGSLLFLVMGFVLDCGSNWSSLKTIGDQLFSKKIEFVKTASNVFWKLHIYLVLILTIIASIIVVEFSFMDLFDEYGFQGAVRLFKGIFSPNFEILPRALHAIVETIYIAFLATFIAVPIAFFFSFVGAKNVMTHPVAFAVYMTLRTFLNIVRSVEPLIWAIIFSVWVGIGPFAGMLALMLHSVASLTKQYSEIVECIDDGPVEGVKATGAGILQTIAFGIVPQIVLPYISFTIYRWDINVRMATVIGLVGGGGIGTMLIQYQGQAMWREVGCIVVVIAVVVWVLDTGSAYIREAIK